MTKIEEINAKMLQEMRSLKIADTPRNRFDFLQGIRDTWLDDPNATDERNADLTAINAEIRRLFSVISKK